VLLSGPSNEGGVPDGPGVNADLVGSAFENPVKVLYGVDAAAYGQGNENGGGYLRQDVGKEGAALSRGGNVVEHQLIGAAVTVKLGQLYRAGHIAKSQEVDALHHPAVLHIQAGNDSLGNHAVTSCGPPSVIAWARSMAPAY